MSKNPKHGYIRCFSCSEPSTVHIVGEAKLLEQGEPPKNKRNTGRYYYVCPSCGTCQPKNAQERISAALVDDASQLPPLEASNTMVSEVEEVKPLTVSKPEEITPQVERIPTSNTDKPKVTLSKTRLYLGGAAALVLIFTLINFFPRSNPNAN
ncbi:MAG: hypothetical protein ACK5MF_04100 [Vibrio sp.]|uniref:hypothetical protein n=1 Tax=Vibrio sp. TaxID=678 RepID=UPI003A8C51A2